MIYWLIFGVISIIITIMIYKNTYKNWKYDDQDNIVYYNKINFYLWELILIIIIGLTPVLNLLGVIVFGVNYLVNINCYDLYFHTDCKIFKILNKNFNS